MELGGEWSQPASEKRGSEVYATEGDDLFSWLISRLAETGLASDAKADVYKRLLRRIGYDPMHWVRYAMYRECTRLVEQLEPETLDACEISAGKEWKKINFKSYCELNFPEFDICKDVADRQFDLIIADNVFEHLQFPYRAGKNVIKMLRPGGAFLNITPFMIRVHDVPIDCSRWTEKGMANFLEECGFSREGMITGSWGNRACVKANFRSWKRVGFYRPMHNEPMYPVQVWVLARKPISA